MKRLTPACRLVLFSLWHKRDYFSRRSMLEKDGSFYYDDKRLSEETGLSGKTIPRVRRFLVGNGYIIIEIGHFKGKATKYWVCRKPDKKSPFVPLLKVDNLSAKVDNSYFKAPQNVPINKVNNKNNNKDNFSNVFKDEEPKDRLVMKDQEQIKELLKDKDFNEAMEVLCGSVGLTHSEAYNTMLELRAT